MISRAMVGSFEWMKDCMGLLRRCKRKTSLGRRYVRISRMSSEGRSRKDCGLDAGFFLDFFSRRFCMRSVFFERSCKAAVVSTSGSSSSSSSSVGAGFFFDRLPPCGAGFVSWIFSSLTVLPSTEADCVV